MAEVKNWRSRFYSQILERGKDYYRRKMVHDLKVFDDQITARVGSSYFYDVSILLDEDGTIRRMSCNCPYAQSGRHCKHEAAVLFGVENEKSVLKKEETRYVRPFEEDFKDKKFFYDLHKLTENYRITSKMLDEARSMIEKGEVVIDDMGSGFNDRYEDQIIYAKGRWKNSRGREYELQAHISPKQIRNLSCEVPGCRSFSPYYYYFLNRKEKDICAHRLALLLLLSRFIVTHDPGDKTDRNSMMFLNEFMRKDSLLDRDDASMRRSVRLIPRLEYDGNGILKLSFRIGDEKLYILKDLPALIDAVEGSSVFRLGTRNTIDFARSSFNDEALATFAYISSAVNDEKTRTEIRNMDYNSGKDSRLFDAPGNILLFGRRLDDFFDLFKDQSIELKDRSRPGNQTVYITMAHQDPQTDLSIGELHGPDGFEGIHVSASLPELIMGSSYGYFLKEDHLYRVSVSYMKAVRALQRNARGNEVDFRIGVHHLGQFYNHVLPKLKQRFTVYENNRELYESHIPPRPDFVFYFDISEGLILCKAQASYNEKIFSLFDDGYDAVRDRIIEDEVKQDLLRYFSAVNENGEAFAEAEDDTVYEMLEELIPSLMKVGEVQTTNAFDRLRVKRRINASVGVHVDNGLLDLDISSDDLSLDELAAVISSYRLKKRYHKLKNGELIRTDDESIETLDEMLASLNVSLKDLVAGKMHIPAYRALYLDKLLEENEGVYGRRDAHFKSLIKDFKTIKDSDFEVPGSLDGIMRAYQKNGYRWLRTLSHFGFGGILADEMGLGKTLQMIAVLLDHKKRGEKGTSLVVCPSSLVYNWLNEITRFAPELDAVTVTGTLSEREEIVKGSAGHDVLITSYDLLRRDVALYEEHEFAYEILDEAQYIKTYTTANARSCKVIRAGKRFALTGTPIENNLSELWSIFDFLMPGFLFNYDIFKRRFEIPISKDQDEDASRRLKDMIAPFILRRRKADVLSDLPDKIEETIVVRFGEPQQRLYDSQALKISRTISEGNEESFRQNKIAILAELMKIRQICCEPSLVFEDYDGESAKREACLELIGNAISEGHKILLFSQFTSMLKIIEDELDRLGIRYYELTGQTKKEDRLKMVEDFNHNDVPLFLISLKAGGTGLNLTGADIVIHYDPWWNVAAQDQATDRTHRIGQEKVVSVFKIIAQGTIEEKIVQMQEAKSKLVEDMLSTETVSLSSMNKEDLLALLR